RLVARGLDAVAAAYGERERLLAEHVQTGFECRRREIGMKGIGCRDHQSVQLRRLQQARQIGMQLLNAVARPQRSAHGSGRVGQTDEVETLAVFPEVEGVLRLPHQPRADQPNPQPLHCFPALLGGVYWPTKFSNVPCFWLERSNFLE